MSAHSSLIGGSTAHRAVNCPGSLKLSAEAPKQPSSIYAQEGTACHAVLEELLTVKLQSPDDAAGKVYEGVTITETMVGELIAPALEAFDVDLMRALHELEGEATFEYDPEQEVRFDGKLEGCFGTADILGRARKTLVVVDFKFGQNGVEVKGNSQMRFYAAAARKNPKMKGVERVLAAIIQPARHDGQPVFTSEVFPVEELTAFENRLIDALELSKMKAPRLRVGDWCRWCPAAVACPALGQTAQTVVAEGPHYPPAMLGVKLRLALELEHWAHAVREAALAALEQGDPVEGFKLVPKRATRQWVDESVVEAALLVAGLTESDIIERKLVSPAQAEKKLKRRFDAVAHLCEAKSSGHTIASEDDPRPAVVLGDGLEKAAAFLKHAPR